MRQLHGNLKCPEQSCESLLLSIQSVMKNEHDNVINQLRKLSSFVQSKNFKTPEEMTKTLKDTTDPMVTYKTLLKTYQDHFVRTMQKGIATLTKGVLK